MEPVKRLDPSKLKDPTTDTVVGSIREAVQELQNLPLAGARIIRNVSVVNNNTVIVAHGLGREPQWVGVSAIRWDGSASIDAGTVFDRGRTDAAGNPIDRTTVVHLAADNFSTAGSVTLTIDLLVF